MSKDPKHWLALVVNEPLFPRTRGSKRRKDCESTERELGERIAEYPLPGQVTEAGQQYVSLCLADGLIALS